MNGTVKFYNRKKGFGFITAEDGNDYFVHVSALEEGVVLRDNDVVSFDVEDGQRGPKAVNVRLTQKASEREGVDAPMDAGHDGHDEAPAPAEEGEAMSEDSGDEQ